MPRTCTICSHSDRYEMDRALLAALWQYRHSMDEVACVYPSGSLVRLRVELNSCKSAIFELQRTGREESKTVTFVTA